MDVIRPRSLLVTGASGGIGRALAEAYAAPGVTLALGGRHRERLEAAAEACRARGATVRTQSCDVTDRAAMASWVAAADDALALDLVIANAGISAGAGGRGESEQQTRDVFAVNLDGVLNTVLPVIPRMRPRRRGQIAIMSSLAGLAALPGAPAYAASKAAVRSWGESLRGWLAADGVRVSVICPGFVDTPLTRGNSYRMPFLMSAPTAARIIRHGLARDRARIAFPMPMHGLMWLFRALPASAGIRLMSRAPKKD